MFEGYTILNNGSKEIQDMEKFFKQKGVDYRTIHKSVDSCAMIFHSDLAFPYEQGEFNSLKALILGL